MTVYLLGGESDKRGSNIIDFMQRSKAPTLGVSYSTPKPKR